MSLTIREVKNRVELKAFISFPEKLYKDSPYWVNALWSDEYKTLLKSKNPAFEYSEAWYFLAERDGKVVGRVAAIINHNANRDWNVKNMRFGWFDFIDDIEVSAALLGRVEELAAEKGMNAVNGPFGFTDMDREGMLVEGFDKMGAFTTLYNYSYYPLHMEKLGFKRDAEWTQREFDVPDDVPDKLKQYSRIIKQKYRVSVLDSKSKKELRVYAIGLFNALNKAFIPLYGFTPISQKQIEWYVDQFLPLINTDLICLVVNEEDRVVAFAVTMPSLSNAMRETKGRLFPFGFIKLLKALKNVDLVDLYMIGIVPEYQNKGLNAVIFDHLNSNFIKLGVKRVIANPQLDSNKAVQSIFDYYPGRLYSKRCCYLKSLS
ncbi:MAG: hypothetical protein PHV12_00410 [Bacteroidales bacterium]|nr:hypothetical protein [Bacteroidales bacterium]